MHLKSFDCKAMEVCETWADIGSSQSVMMGTNIMIQGRVHGIVCIWINLSAIFLFDYSLHKGLMCIPSSIRICMLVGRRK